MKSEESRDRPKQAAWGKPPPTHRVLGQCDEAHIVLGVAAGLGVTYDVDSVLLGLQPGGQEVPIPHVLTVIHTVRLGVKEEEEIF